MNSTTTVRRILAAVPALFMSRVPVGVFAHGGHVHLSHGWVSKNKGGCAMPRHLCLALLVTLGFLLGGRHVAQAASFTFTPIDVPGASLTQAFGISPSGQIVGIYFNDTTGNHGFLYDQGVFTPIDVPGASETRALGINPSGQIVGGYSDGTGPHGFLYNRGVFTPIDVPGASLTQAFGINPSGQIVGNYVDRHGFLYDRGVFTPIDVPGALATGALGINPSGQIVGLYVDNTGFHGFLATHKKK